MFGEVDLGHADVEFGHDLFDAPLFDDVGVEDLELARGDALFDGGDGAVGDIAFPFDFPDAVEFLGFGVFDAVEDAGVAAFFVAVFWGNISQFLNGVDAFGLDSDAARAIRLVFQPVLVAWALWCTGAWGSFRQGKGNKE